MAAPDISYVGWSFDVELIIPFLVAVVLLVAEDDRQRHDLPEG